VYAKVISSFFYGILLFGRKNFCAGDFTTTVKAESIGQLLKTFQVSWASKIISSFYAMFSFGRKSEIQVFSILPGPDSSKTE
jgi:hypothetical protein